LQIIFSSYGVSGALFIAKGAASHSHLYLVSIAFMVRDKACLTRFCVENKQRAPHDGISYLDSLAFKHSLYFPKDTMSFDYLLPHVPEDYLDHPLSKLNVDLFNKLNFIFSEML
jgi:hypothetical protein